MTRTPRRRRQRSPISSRLTIWLKHLPRAWLGLTGGITLLLVGWVMFRPQEVAVFVMDEFTGQPIANASINATQHVLLTDQAGLAMVPGLTHGTILSTQADGYEAASVQFGGEAAIRVNLRPNTLSGIVYNASTGRPLAGALVLAGNIGTFTNPEGVYQLRDLPPKPVLTVKLAGYRRFQQPVGAVTRLDVAMQPIQVKGIYIPFGLLALPDKITELLDMVDHTELNAVVVDVKGDRGRLAYQSQMPLAQAVGAFQAGLLDIREFLRQAQARHIYTIARLVQFKDPILAQGRPDLAVKTPSGDLWIDGEGLAWVDPFQREVWDYNIAIAREVAALGFDEIQVDYVRFPSDGSISTAHYSRENTSTVRGAIIPAYLAELQSALLPYGVYLSADVFGLTVAAHDEMGIGQYLEDLVPYLDYLCPMIYPSTWTSGNLGLQDPSATPYQTVRLSSEMALRRSPVRVRPWLQAYWYGLPEMLAQKQAAEDAGAAGWSFWNAAGVYDAALFHPRS